MASDDATIPPVADPDATIAPAMPPGPAPTDSRAPAGYVIEKELGRGGMGVVYLARHLGLGRPCALKMLLGGVHSGSAEVDRFKTEAQAIARLQHPGIVQVFEIGDHDGRPFMALEFCGGGSLDAVLAKNPLEPHKAAELVRSLAEAVQAAHDAKVIHRDLKPANVLLTEKGEPKISDFGLAKKLDESGATRTGSVMGTPSYMPPEQAEGKEVGPPADVYALGAILYECLAGRPPFRAATALDTLMQVLAEEPVPVRQLNHHVPADLETIALKCLRKDSRKRYGSARDLAEDLGRWSRGEPIKARPVGHLERAIKWVRRNKVVSALLALVVLSVSTGFALVYGYWREADHQRQLAQGELSRAETALYVNRIARAQAAWRAGTLDVTRRVLDECPEGQRGWEWFYLHRLCNPALRTWRTEPDNAWSSDGPNPSRVAISRDGRLVGVPGLLSLVGHREIGTVPPPRLYRVADGVEIPLHTTGRHLLTNVAFSPDGKLFAAAGRDTGPDDGQREAGAVLVWEVDAGRLVHTLHGGFGPQADVRHLAFTDDGRTLVAASTFAVQAFDARTGERTSTIDPSLLIRSLAVSPDGRTIALAVAHGGLCLLDRVSGRRIHGESVGPVVCSALGYSPDGNQLLVASRDLPGDASIWDVATWRPTVALRGQTALVRCGAFTPDGARVVVGSEDGTVSFHDAFNGQPLAVLRCGSEVRSVAVSGDGTLLVASTSSGEVLLWDATTVPEVRAWDVHHDVAYLGDGPTLAARFVGDDEVAILAEARAARAGKKAVELHLSTLDGDRVGALACGEIDDAFGRSLLATSADGRRLIVAVGRRLTLVDRAGGPRRSNLTPSDDQAPAHLALSPDGKWLAESNARGVVVRDLDNGQELLRLNPSDGVLPEGPVTFAPDGQRLLVGLRGQGRWYDHQALWDVPQGKLHRRFVDHGTTADGEPGRVRASARVAFSPDGKALFVFEERKGLSVHDVATERLIRTVPDLPYDAVLSPDRSRCAAAGDRGDVDLWDTAIGQRLLRLPLEKKVSAEHLAFSPDGKGLIATAGSGVFVWSIAAADPDRVLREWPARARRWHQRAAEWTLRKRYFRPLEFHLTTLLVASPGDPALLLRRAHCRVEQKQWREANDDLAQAAAKQDGWRLRRQQALVLWSAGDRVAYREACSRMVAQVATVPDAKTARLVLEVCALGEEGMADREALEGLVGIVLKADPEVFTDPKMEARTLKEAVALLREPALAERAFARMPWPAFPLVCERLGHPLPRKTWAGPFSSAVTNWPMAASTTADREGRVLGWDETLAFELIRREVVTLAQTKRD